MPNRYFAGNSLAAFTRTSTSCVESTAAGTFDSTYAQNSIQIPGNIGTITSTTFSATGTVYVRFDIHCTSSGGVSGTILQLNNGGTGVFRLVVSGGNAVNPQPQYWNGSAWTNTGGLLGFSSGARSLGMLKIVLGSGFEYYQANTLITSGSGWTGGGTTVTTITLGGTNSVNFYHSQIMIADYDIRDSHFQTAAVNGNSAANTGAASGVFTDVNETVLDDTTVINIATLGNKSGQTKAAITVPAGYQIAAMVINSRSKVVAAAGVTDLKLGIRSGGTNYPSSARGATSSFGPLSYISATDPATSAQFTQSGFNSAEIYTEAA